MTAREAAFVSLQKYENNKKFANIEADAAIRRNHLEGADRNLYTAVFYGTIERKITLDYLLAALCTRGENAVDSNVRILLRMSLYQMFYLDRVPDYAILHDAGELCRRFAADRAVPFVNGVLRSAQRMRERGIVYPDEKKEPIAYLSVYYSYPVWLCRMWCEQYGYQKTKRIFEAFSENPTLTLRVNTEKTTTEAVLAALKEKTVGAHETKYVRGGIRLTGHTPLSEIPGFDDGNWFIQDEASQICASVLDAQPGETVLDACACPGGKSFSTALWMKNTGSLVACDLHKNKLSLVSDGAQRLGISILTVREQNGAEFVPEWENAFDRVLCDVPCSGLGVLSKKPDIRHKEEDEITRLPSVQYAILENCARYVKKGGILVYSTCTLNPAENEENVRKFLTAHPAFSPCPIVLTENKAIRKDDGMLTVFPDEFVGCDGFFVAKLKKTP